MSEKLKFVLEFCDSALIQTLLAAGNSQKGFNIYQKTCRLLGFELTIGTGKLL